MLALLSSLAVAAASAAASPLAGRAQSPDIPRPADPFADPKDDPYNPLKYIANDVLTAIAFTLVVLVAFIQTWFTWKWKTRFMLSMVIGEYTFALGLAMRFGLHTNPEGKGLYIVEYLFVVLSPCAFIASNYVLLGRLARYLHTPHHLLVPARRITLLFLSSDITTFLIQAAGGSLTISANNPKQNLAGSHIFLAGLVLQLVSFASFTAVYLRWLHRVRRHSPQAWARDAGLSWWRDWRALAGALVLSCAGILIRSVYRTVELSQGFEGRLATVEAFFYALDTLPLFLAVSVYVPFWPGRFIPSGVSALAKDGAAGDGVVGDGVVGSGAPAVEGAGASVEGSVEKQD
ncbi:RTA1-domain-containing protein [Athelia psychrophila]|uniref:RTA1-domain-containing protein n=1 Tax=Athelia psychrophila TaxID=1759441 RepID=A0A166VRQ9_9AGAM|nr:RTA1-domain-containing protein [Fibularhizoctonia sp. CBS 109695]